MQPFQTSVLPIQRELSQSIKKRSQQIQSGSPSIFKLPLREIGSDPTNKLRSCEIGFCSGEQIPEKKILVIGATGTGKTTFINGMANFLFNAQWDEDFRFKLITETGDSGSSTSNQAISQTEYITSYTFHHTNGFAVPYSVTVIDTPGFGDTRGIQRDKLLVEQIRGFFEGKGPLKIDQLDAIALVVKSPDARLTPTQKYIFDSVLSIFGKDIVQNIFIIATFADGGEVQALSALKAANVPYKGLFKFNNSALYIANTSPESMMSQMFWFIGFTSYQTFFSSMSVTPPVSLVLTKEVLKERVSLQAVAQNLHSLIKQGTGTMSEMQQHQQIIQDFDAEMSRTKNYVNQVTVPIIKKIDLACGEHVTNCLQCNRTCHYPCYIPEDSGKRGCAAMSGDNCNICPGKCHWSRHVNNRCRYEDDVETRQVTDEQLRQRYSNASGGKASKENILSDLKRQYESKKAEVKSNIQNLTKVINDLRKIAAKSNALSTVDYIAILIEAEEKEARPGWQERKKGLMEAMEQAGYVANAELGKDLPNL